MPSLPSRIMHKLCPVLLFLMNLTAFGQTIADDPEVGDALDVRVHELVDLFQGKVDARELFAPGFFAQVPIAQLEAVVQELRQSCGSADAVAHMDVRSPNSATVFFDFEKAVVQMDLAIELEAPFRVE